MKMQAVESSDIRKVGFEAGRLRVLFKRGGAYDYLDVPEIKYDALLHARSKGRFFHECIKDQYDYEKVQ